MIVQMEKTPSTASRERAQQLYNKTIELENKRQKSLQARIPSDPNAWFQIRENYESIILEDHAFSEQHNIEFALWQLHYKRIEEFRAHLNTAQASVRSSATNSGRGPPPPDRLTKIRVQFKAFLSEATGFYHDLILKIRAKYGLPLGHFSDEDNLALTGTDNAKSSAVKKALVSCHRCLIYLGDLARYKGLYGEAESRAREYSAASSYYVQAAALWPANGNPHHQLAILATYSSDELVAVYRYFRSLAAEIPFLTAKDNLVVAFEKNRQSHTQLLETIRTSVDRQLSIKEKLKEFCTQFVRLHGVIFSRTSLEMFPGVLSSVSDGFRELLSSGPEEEKNFGTDGMENGLAILRLIAVLIFTVHNVHKKNEGQTYAEILQHTVLFENACTITFELMSLIVERCLQLRDPSSSFLLPGILVFLEWLACCPDVAACTSDDKQHSTAKLIFWKHCIAFFNKLLSSQMVSFDDDGDESCFTNMNRYEEGETDSRFALWEDFELRGFLPLLPAQNILDFTRKHSIGAGGNNREKQTRIKRIIASGKALASVAMIDQKAVYFDSKMKQFVIGIQPQVSLDAVPGSCFGSGEPPLTEQEIAMSSIDSNSMVMRGNVQMLFEGEDDDEEIVFKPAFIEKKMDAIGSTLFSPLNPEQGKNTSLVAPQHRPMMDFSNSALLVEQHASLADGLKKLRFVENGNVLTSDTKGGLRGPEGGSHLLPQASVSFMDHAMYPGYRRNASVMIPSKVKSVAFSDVITDNMAVKQPSISTATFKSQAGRPVRHLGPPPGFRPVPPKHVNTPVPNIFGGNGSLAADDYSWLDGNQMLSSTSGMGPYHAGNQVSLGNTQFVSNVNISHGNSSLPFPGMQTSGVQFQGGNLKSYQEFQSFQNLNPNHGNKLLDQQHVMTGNQSNHQQEHYHGQSPWSGQYHV